MKLLKRTTDIYGHAAWTVVRSGTANGSRTKNFRVVATDEDQELYRAVVAYRGLGSVRSTVAQVQVWRWIPLADFPKYYSAGSVLTQYTSVSINGTMYPGWTTYGDTPSWETRHTPGRNCKAFRGELGVQDGSDDGSSATIELLTDETSSAYVSGPLTPGMVEHVEIPLDLPYRFTILARSTSPDGIHVYPGIGAPEFLCSYAS
ncbi:hypothetical protein FB382_003064 [Nocardioides ginsengisegetis]|uniref:Uncharacterized protein n=1 Tax=Nocardioides ginsengisegetis TaxID=661491 RepID=A0A7W3J1V5_9ACTN|nr:hypothetical protein [Nocardioides ginsengisegetis]MBA8804773.1 hypothetical protein [Nocardioides ginsengisegetis]